MMKTCKNSAWQLVIASLVSNRQQMQGISDPETFELSQTVEKSSKSGIFTNKRLLMIKDGFLYYFSNVPSDYKTHQPNVMSTLKEFPKSSIEIRSIQGIKLESAKSSTLVITFYDKDMIDREDIRKSLSSKNYNHPVKPNRDDLEEWKFIFATVMKCRLWYGSLVKLKQHFVKSQDKFDKFAEYMANFDPQIRSSLPQLSPNNSNRASAPTSFSSPNIPVQNSPTKPAGINSPESKYKMEKESGIFEIQESNEQYDEQITPKNNVSKFEDKDKKNEKEEPKPIVLTSIENEIKKQEPPKSPVNKIIEKEQPPKPKIQEVEQKQIRKQAQAKPVEVVSQEIIINLPPSQQSISREVSIAEDIRRQQQQQQSKRAEEAARAEEQARAEKQTALYNEQLKNQEELIRKMNEEIENNKRAKQQLEQKVREEQERREEEERLRIMLEREKREEEEYKRLRESIRSQPPLHTDRGSKEIVVREESIQTEYQRQLIDVIEGSRQPSKLSRYSFKSDLSLSPLTDERQTLNLFRNTISYISEVKIQTHEVESYDYFWEMGQLYCSTDVKERISRELQLAEFVSKASKKATELIVHYIDFNRPRESVTIDRNMFQIEIVCERGRLIRTEGSQRLIYPNQNHQRLKRCFKIYNQLTESILVALKKKSSFPLRVPFACLVEYKGYTALARIIPPLRDHSLNAQHLKLLASSIPLYNLTLSDFECRGITYSIVQPTIYFKPTKEDETSIARFPEKSNDFLSSNRRANISISSNKLFQQSKQIQSNFKERLKLAEVITFCRELKKIMKANTPYTDDANNEFQFFDDFLKHPTTFMDEPVSTGEPKINGLLLYYIERLLGIKMKTKLNGQEELSYFAVPVKRKFTLTALDVGAFAANFERYLYEKKYDLAERSLGYSKQLEEDYSETLMREVSLHISTGRCHEALERLELCQQMISLHDPRRLRVLELRAQCLQAVGEVSLALGTLKTLLEETEYAYSNQARGRLIEVYFLLADLLSRQNLTPQLIQVYRRILQESPESRQKVLLDFSRNLLQLDTDPHILLDFLQKQLPESIEQKDPRVQHLLGELYYRVKNRPKALGFFVNALSGLLGERKQLDQVYEVFQRAIQCCGSIREKKSCHRQLLGKLAAAGFSQEESKKLRLI